VILILLGCYLLDDGVIDCAADEPCATVDTQETAVEGDADADTDTDTDTDVVAARTVGSVHSAESDGTWRFVVSQPNAVRRLDHSASGVVAGPALWMDDTNRGLVASGSELWAIDDNGSFLAQDLNRPVQDLLRQDTRLLLLTPTSISSLEGSNPGVEVLDNEALGNATRLALAGDDAVWILDLHGPTVWSLGLNDSLEPLYSAYDDTALRSVGLFVGPDEGPWVCSGSGGVWSVAALAEGEKAPWRLAQDTSGVVDCGYDPGSDEVLLFTTIGAVVRLGPDNRTSTWLETPGLVRGRPYTPF